MINVTRSSMPDYKEYCDEISDLWDSHYLTNNGMKHQELENKIKEYLKTPNVTLYTNGHLALENIISVYNFPKDSEVITTPFTFVSTVNAIIRCGLVPVFCDINPNDYTIDVNKIEDLITDKTVMILPVHVYGNICNVEKIDEIAKKNNLKVIYDAAHAFNEKYKKIDICNYGDAAMFSFHATKVFNTIEGGMVSYKDSIFKEKLDILKNFGLKDLDGIYFGGNAKMNEFQAAMGLCNLRHLDEEILKRKKVYEEYINRLRNISGIKLNYIKEDVISNYAYFPIIFDNYKYSRDEVFEKLKENGIMARKYFYPAINDMTCYLKYNKKNTPVAKMISENVLTLPMYADLSINDVNKICDIIIN